MAETATISGYAAVFDQEAVILGLFRERIRRGAFAESLRRDDILASFNHDLNQLLGRTSVGTLRLDEDSIGLHYKIALNERDPLALSVAAKIARRDVSGSSFAFEPTSPDDETWERGKPGQLPLRTLRRVRLIECGPVARPCYRQTTATARDVASSPAYVGELARARERVESARRWRP